MCATKKYSYSTIIEDIVLLSPDLSVEDFIGKYNGKN